MKKHTAIEIDSPAVFDLVKMLEPIYEGIEYDDVHLKFAVFGFPSKGDLTILNPDKFLQVWDRIENGVNIRLKMFIAD